VNTTPSVPINPALTVRVGADTSIGHFRKNNEDAFSLDDRLGLYIVSDGMGGMQHGDIAARLVTQVLPRMIESQWGRTAKLDLQEQGHMIQEQMLFLSRAIHEQSHANGMSRGMGATAVLAFLSGDCALIAHQGDSRAYLFRKHRLIRLTRDHSVVAMLLRAGEITQQEALRHPARAQLTRFMGMRDSVPGDLCRIRSRPGDRLLLCSDGLFGMVPDSEIARLLETRVTPEDAAHTLIQAADDAGGQDNSTAVVIDFNSKTA
jgi:protein phosphatase